MPFSFIDIEESKSRIIALVFVSIILFYFLTAYILLIVIENSFAFYIKESYNRTFFSLPPLKHTLTVLAAAFLAALFHWLISTGNLIEKISIAIGAVSIDPKDTYHQYFKNIVDEVSVAMGGRPIEAMIIPFADLNSFSLQDFNRRAFIGITEGLLSRLNRYQIEAVVAHEAGHIIGGDSLTTTVICSLSELYEEGLSRIKAGLRNTRGRGGIILVLIFIVLSVMHFLSSLLRYFISRQREYRADAIAVRLTRNPLSLAEALKLISKHWNGSGAQGQNLESIFIVNPKFNSLDEEEGLLADIFSTHPPINRRINILLGMAHMDEKTLEENLRNFKRASPVAKAEFMPLDSAAPKKWFILDKEQNWLGPFILEDLKKIDGLRPDQWVRTETKEVATPLYDDDDLRTLFLEPDKQKKEPCCPHCKVALQELIYEGAPILKCPYCEGVFVENQRISRILIRKDSLFPEDIIRSAKTILKSKDRYKLSERDAKSAWVIICPKCRLQMHRQFFVYSYPVEIDRCINCSGVWFDKQELEILQYLFEHKELLYNEKGF